MLKTAFDQKDAAALERLLAPCVTEAVRPGGGSAQPRERYISDLRQQLAAGLVVTVDTSAIKEYPGGGGLYVLSRWNATPPGGGAPAQTPRGETQTVELMLGRTAGGFHWSGSIVVFEFPR
jgi:hypothetical protein